MDGAHLERSYESSVLTTRTYIKIMQFKFKIIQSDATDNTTRQRVPLVNYTISKKKVVHRNV